MHTKTKLNELIVSLLLVIGLFFPTSNSFMISETNTLIMLFLLLFLVLILIAVNGTTRRGLKYTFSIVIIVGLSTFLGMAKYTSSNINLGVFLQIFIFSLILLLNYQKISIAKSTIRAFKIVNIINIVLGLLIIIDNLTVKTFFLKHYAAYYSDLMPNMLRNNKPVLYFGSHSIAGFFIYLFFYLNFLHYKKTKSKSSLIFLLLNIVLLINIKSVTAIILFAIAIVQTIYFFYKTKKIALIALLPVCVYLYITYGNYLTSLTNKVFSSSLNGFAGRYSSTGVIQQNFEYLKNNLLPIGVLNLDQIYYTDNGFVLNLIYGSVFLIIAIYGGLITLLSANIKSKVIALWLFGLFFAFEWGFPILYYARTLYLIPFIIIFIRYLEEVKEVEAD